MIQRDKIFGYCNLDSGDFWRIRSLGSVRDLKVDSAYRFRGISRPTVLKRSGPPFWPVLELACSPRFPLLTSFRHPDVISILEEFMSDARDISLVWPKRRFVPARVRQVTDFFAEAIPRFLRFTTRNLSNVLNAPPPNR